MKEIVPSSGSSIAHVGVGSDVRTEISPILFFDGRCGLCTRSVRWCLRLDRRGVLKFAPLQGATYAELNIPGKPTNPDSAVLIDAAGVHTRSDMALRVLHHLGGGWRWIGFGFALVPRLLRDAAYHFISTHRVTLSGAPKSCPRPTAAKSARLLP